MYINALPTAYGDKIEGERKYTVWALSLRAIYIWFFIHAYYHCYR